MLRERIMENQSVVAEFTTFKNIPTRNTMQLVFEVPIEQAKQVIDKLGYPDAHTSNYVKINKLEYHNG